ncbi:MAG: anaerobic ribonucleoside-triphosphate reductase activating protein [Cyanobacteria bacterium SIG30]|nr:anaerobic ribonucleoside-triphosphate reductase activating protein [Cyanobacteria bacterium SIG30]
MRIYQIIEKTSVEGPGIRFCIWAQGCSRHCEGCFAKETWNHSGGIEYSVEEIFEKIKNTKEIEGVTFLGGEPFEQAKDFALLAKKIKSLGLSVLCFTGFTIEELKKSNNKHIKDFLDNIDLLIDSPFEQDKISLDMPWIGSSNQRYIFLTDKYNMDEIKKYKNKVEVRIQKNGAFIINGMGDFSKIKEKFIEKVI